MSDLSDAIKNLESDAQYLKDNLPNIGEPPTLDELRVVEAFIGVTQRLDRLREVTGQLGKATASGGRNLPGHLIARSNKSNNS